MNDPISGWQRVLVDALNSGKTVSVLVDGTYKPYVGKVTKVSGNVATLKNEYATEYVSIPMIKAVKVYG